MHMNESDDKNFDDELMATAAELTTEVTPDRDLWPGIEQAILQPAKPARTVWNSVWAQAAAVLLLVAGSSGVTYLAVTEHANELSPVSGGPTLVFEPVSGSFGSMYNLGPDYQDARRTLAAKLEDELSRLTPEEPGCGIALVCMREGNFREIYDENLHTDLIGHLQRYYCGSRGHQRVHGCGGGWHCIHYKCCRFG
jgi:hypothetical protein